ncbi:MAG: LPS export ABC transporter periplasmic protein LptC [bacterium]|nr:LPS export ABC transporter periplasmic protein LptC [bacterium]
MSLSAGARKVPRAAAVAAALASLVHGLAACGDGGTPSPAAAPPSAPAENGPRPRQELLDYRLTESAAGVRQWVLTSDRMLRFAGREDLELTDVHMDFHREGAHFSTLDADSGRVNPRTRAVHVWGAVDVVTTDGRRLQTEDLVFDNVTGRISNEVFNRYTHGTDVLTGYGLDATPDLAHVEIKREVAAVVTDQPATTDGQP